MYRRVGVVPPDRHGYSIVWLMAYHSTEARKPFQFYGRTDYHKALLKSLSGAKAGDRIALTTMTFNPVEADVARIMEALLAAAGRGAAVTLAVDAHSFMKHDRRLSPTWWYPSLPLQFGVYRHKLKTLQALNACPTGRAVVINKPRAPFSLPIAGRSHIKIALVNETIFLGGCNLSNDGSLDMMIGWQDSQDADRLHRVVEDIVTNQHAGRALNHQDQQWPLGSQEVLFIDAGTRGVSRILGEALALIDSAQEWIVLTCQFFPNSITARHLAAAYKRGVKVEVIYSHPGHHGPVGGLGQQVSILRERGRLPAALFAGSLDRSDPFLHAKLIATDKGMMIGSHNYVRAGVRLGTAEIALRSHDAALSRQAVITLQRELRQTTYGARPVEKRQRIAGGE